MECWTGDGGGAPYGEFLAWQRDCGLLGTRRQRCFAATWELATGRWPALARLLGCREAPSAACMEEVRYQSMVLAVEPSLNPLMPDLEFTHFAHRLIILCFLIHLLDDAADSPKLKPELGDWTIGAAGDACFKKWVGQVLNSPDAAQRARFLLEECVAEEHLDDAMTAVCRVILGGMIWKPPGERPELLRLHNQVLLNAALQDQSQGDLAAGIRGMMKTRVGGVLLAMSNKAVPELFGAVMPGGLRMPEQILWGVLLGPILYFYNLEKEVARGETVVVKEMEDSTTVVMELGKAWSLLAAQWEPRQLAVRKHQIHGLMLMARRQPPAELRAFYEWALR